MKIYKIDIQKLELEESPNHLKIAQYGNTIPLTADFEEAESYIPNIKTIDYKLVKYKTGLNEPLGIFAVRSDEQHRLLKQNYN